MPHHHSNLHNFLREQPDSLKCHTACSHMNPQLSEQHLKTPITASIWQSSLTQFSSEESLGKLLLPTATKLSWHIVAPEISKRELMMTNRFKNKFQGMRRGKKRKLSASKSSLSPLQGSLIHITTWSSREKALLGEIRSYDSLLRSIDTKNKPKYSTATNRFSSAFNTRFWSYSHHKKIPQTYTFPVHPHPTCLAASPDVCWQLGQQDGGITCGFQGINRHT